MNKKITPKSLVLGLLQASNKRAMPVKTLISAGDIFGFTSNTIRVATTRLIREGTIESNERGLYHLSDKNTLFSRFIETWKEGENRRKVWNQNWVCCLVLNKKSKGKPAADRAFEFLGFKEGLPNLWVRPDNLSVDHGFLEALLSHFGKLEQKEVFVAKEFSDKLTAQWMNFLWPVDEIFRKQQAFLIHMEKSAARLEKMPLEHALAESFLVGSEAIHLLISDPLLPDQMMEDVHRVALTQAMVEYDELGKQIWSKRFDEIQIDQSPAHLQLVPGLPVKLGGG